MLYPGLLQFGYVHIECFVDFLHIKHERVFNAVQELTAGNAHSVTTEIPVKEHPSRDDPLIISVALKAVVLSIVLAQLGLTKD